MNWVPGDIDTTKPNPARVYDYLLGGNHNFQADREAAQKIIDASPQNPRKAVWLYRRFLRQTVRICLDAGITQFLDLGSGLPTMANIHETAQKLDPNARVVYVDIDPVAYEHSRSLLADNPGVAVVHADLRDTDRVLNSPETTRLLNLDQPLALIMAAVIHFIPDSDDPAEVIQCYTRRLVTDSYFAMTHGSEDGKPWNEAVDTYRRSVANLVPRSRSQIETFFTGFELVGPGITWLEDWPTDPYEMPLPDPPSRIGYAAIGRKR